MEDIKLSPHQAWQEVKKIQRFFDVLDRTEEVLKVLAEYDAIKAKLTSEIPVLEQAAQKVKEQTETMETLLVNAKAAYDKTKADILQAHKESEKTMEEAKTRSNQQLENMKNQARASVESCRMELASLQPEVAKLQAEKKDLEQAIDGLKKQAADQVNSLVGAFKTLGK